MDLAFNAAWPLHWPSRSCASLLLVALLSGCYSEGESPCLGQATAESCASDFLQCEVLGLCGIVERNPAAGLCNECAPTEDSHCAESQTCKTTGACSIVFEDPTSDDPWDFPICRPSKASHCQDSKQCKNDGRKCKFFYKEGGLPACID